jgi:hypothetical protein
VPTVQLKTVTIGVLAQILAFAGHDQAHAAKLIQPFSVEVAAGVAGDPALEQGIYLFRARCAANLSGCVLERITLNECKAGADGKRGFVPRSEFWETSSGRMKVRRSGPHESS